MKNPEIDNDGTKRWYNDKGQLHREDGPAVECVNGTKCWYRNGSAHRDGGPAYECCNGEKIWLRHGKRHRVDGPAYIAIFANGECYCNYWYVNGKEIDVNPILERLEISPDWRSWTDAEKMIVRLALP